MKQKRKVKSLLPKKNFVNGKFLTILLVVLSLVLCVGGVSLLTNSVWAGNNDGVKIVVYHHYSYLSGSSCDVVAGKGDKYLYATGDSIEINLDELLLSKGYLFSHLTYDTYSGQNRLYDVKSDNNIVHVYYDADAQQDVNGNNVPDSQEKQDLTINYLYKSLSGHAISGSEKIKLLFNENYTVTGKSLNCYYFEPEFITGVKLCGAETAKFYYTAKGECDQNNDGVSDDEENIVTIHHVYTGGKLIATEHYLVISGQAFISYNYDGNLWHNTVNNQHYDRQPKSITDGDVTGDRQYTFIYYPNHDCNQNGIADEEETRQIKIDYSCKICKKDPYQCNIPSYEGVYELNKSFDTPIPQVPGYRNVVPDKSVIEGSCEDQQTIGVVLTLSEPEKDQNNDCVWDGEQELWEITEFDYTGLDNRVEVLYGMRFLDPSDFTKIVNSIYMSGSSLYISPNPVIVNGSNNTVDTGVYSHILGGENNEVYSNNITLIAGSNNKIYAGNDNASVLGGNGNEVMPGKSGGIPAILVGGESNVMGTGHDGNALIGGSNNTIGPIEDPYADVDEVSDSIVLGGERNAIGIDSYNVIIGGKKVLVQGKHNIFVYSNIDIDGGFSPRSHNAFYLNVGSGAGINTGGIEGLSVGGAVSIGRVNINIDDCTGDSLGVIGSYDGCLVGCTKVSLNDGRKWELLDQGNECAKICQNNSGHCLNQDDEVVNVEDSRAQCTEGVVNTDNAELCINDLDSYRGVFFETSLIDSNETCPTTGQNICVYKCKSGYHLTGTAGHEKCYADCPLPWSTTTSIRHGETVTGYNTTNVACSNDEYIFPRTTEYIRKGKPLNNPLYDVIYMTVDGTRSPKAKSGTSFESCGNYDHKKTLICNNGTLYLIDENGRPTGEIEAKKYKNKSCNLNDYSCNTSVYSLTSGQIISNKKDAPQNNIWDVADRGTLTGKRGIYEACIDYNADQTSNGESCSKITYHYKFIGCKAGYVLGDDGICRKDCTLIGSSEPYHQGDAVTGFVTTGVNCPNVCTGSRLVCDDGVRHLGSSGGEEAVGDWYKDCNPNGKTCGKQYIVNSAEYNTGKDTGYYRSCTGYSTAGNSCTDSGTVYELTGCISNYHTENMKRCVSNTKYVPCRTPVDGKPTNSSYITGEGTSVKISWDGAWNAEGDNWETPAICKWTCNTGYTQMTGDDGKPYCVTSACGDTEYTCLGTGVTATNQTAIENGYKWNCLGSECLKCNLGYTGVDGMCVLIQDGLCGVEPYDCSGGVADGRDETIFPGWYWECKGIGADTTGDICHKCVDDYSHWNGVRCECDAGYTEVVEAGGKKVCNKLSYSCSLTEPGMCESADGSSTVSGTNVVIDEHKYTWSCGDTDCPPMCEEGYHLDGDGNCVQDVYEICIYSEDGESIVPANKMQTNLKLKTVDGRNLPEYNDFEVTLKYLNYCPGGSYGGGLDCQGTNELIYKKYVISGGNNVGGFYGGWNHYEGGTCSDGCGSPNAVNLDNLYMPFVGPFGGDRWVYAAELSSTSYPYGIDYEYIGRCPEQKKMPDNGCFNWMDDFLYYWDGLNSPVRLNRISRWFDFDSGDEPDSNKPYENCYLDETDSKAFEEKMLGVALDIDFGSYNSDISVDNIYIPCYDEDLGFNGTWCKLKLTRKKYKHQWEISDLQADWDTYGYCVSKGY